MSTILELAIRDYGSYRPTTPAGDDSMPVEAIGRILLYTEKELSLADDVLSRFAWRYATEAPLQDASREAEVSDSLIGPRH